MLKEETGIVLTNEKIHDCGLFQYLPYKDLHLYLVEADVDVTKLSLGFSPLINGNVKILSLNTTVTEIDKDNDTMITLIWLVLLSQVRALASSSCTYFIERQSKLGQFP